MLNEPLGNASGRRESAELLLRMKRLGISVWHPDPIKECERVEAARAKIALGGFLIHAAYNPSPSARAKMPAARPRRACRRVQTKPGSMSDSLMRSGQRSALIAM